ncbi:MAG: flagellar motor protein MotB [Desulfatitalea sp.]|nr:flagellar motor protein MotB [Desulfatitalea sp.]
MKRISLSAVKAPDSSQSWLTTFNDMVTLLMVFFVLLFSMGTMDDRRFAHFQNALQSAMGVLHEGRHASEGLISDQPRSIDTGVTDLAAVEGGSGPVGGLPRTEGLEAEYTRRGLELRLSDELLFGTGSAELTTAGERLLGQVGAVIQPMGRQIRVEGHTDDRPIATTRYPSNWELSTDRAVQVVRFLIDTSDIPAAHMAAAGYGPSRPRAANATEAGRGVNRRVAIILGGRYEALGDEDVLK